MIRLIAYSLIILNVLFVMPIPFTYIDSKIELEYNDYLGIVKSHCNKEQYDTKNHIVLVTILPKKYLGMCTKTVGKFIILLNKKEVEKMKSTEKFQLISHELFHCLFDAPHSDNFNSYMYFEFNDIPPDLVRIQVEQDIRDRCK